MLGSHSTLLTITVLVLTGCADTLVIKENPFDSEIGRVETVSGTTTKFYAPTGQQTVASIERAEIIDSDKARVVIEYQSDGLPKTISRDDGSYLTIDWSMPQQPKVTVAYQTGDGEVSETAPLRPYLPTFRHTAGDAPSNPALLDDSIEPTNVDVNLLGCETPPTLDDVRHVETTLNYGLGPTTLFPKRVSDSKYRLRLDLGNLRNLLRNDVEVERRIADTIEATCAVAGLFSTQAIDRLCTAVGFTNPNISRICGALISPLSAALCSLGDVARSVQRIKERELASINGNFSGVASVAYLDFARQTRWLTSSRKHYVNGGSPISFDMQLPCEAIFKGPVTASGSGTDDECTSNPTIRAEINGIVTLTLPGNSAAVRVDATRVWSECFSQFDPDLLWQGPTTIQNGVITMTQYGDYDDVTVTLTPDGSGKRYSGTLIDHHHNYPHDWAMTISGTFTISETERQAQK